MAGSRSYGAGRILLYLGLLLVFDIPEVKSHSDGDAECYKLVKRMSEAFSHVRLLNCEYGCCGTVAERYCCSEEETYGAQWRAWRLAGIVVGSTFFVTLVVIFVCCIYKKKSKKRSRINDRRADSGSNQTSTIGISNIPSNVPDAPLSFMYVAPTSFLEGTQNITNEKNGIPNYDQPPRYTTALYDD